MDKDHILHDWDTALEIHQQSLIRPVLKSGSASYHCCFAVKRLGFREMHFSDVTLFQNRGVTVSVTVQIIFLISKKLKRRVQSVL